MTNTNTIRIATEYVLYPATGSAIYFRAANDRAARGEARRLLGRRRPVSTYYQGDDFAFANGLRAITAYNLGRGYDCETAALYAVVKVAS